MHTPEDTLMAFCKHLAALRRRPELRTARFVVIPESNLGFHGNNLRMNFVNMVQPSAALGRALVSEEDLSDPEFSHFLSNLRENVTFMTGVYQNNVGILTTHKSKRKMAEALASRLHDGMLAFHHALVCQTSGDNFSPEDAKEELVRQIKHYEDEPVLNSEGEVIDGRLSGKKSGPDDLCIALQVVNLYAQMWMKNPRRYSAPPT